jgi:hypothetical protein
LIKLLQSEKILHVRFGMAEDIFMSCGIVLPSASSKVKKKEALHSSVPVVTCYMMLFDIRSMKLKFILTLSYYLSTLEAFLLLFFLLFKEPPLVKIV